MIAEKLKKSPRRPAGRGSPNTRTRLVAFVSAAALLTAGAVGLGTAAVAADTGLEFSEHRIGISLPVGVQSDTLYLSITNTTAVELTAEITGGLFPGSAEIERAENTCAQITTLAAGDTCRFGYRVTPARTGTVSYHDPIVVNGVSRGFFFDVTGEPLFVQRTLAFGGVFGGTVNHEKLRVENRAAYEVTPTGLTVAPGAPFSVAPGTCAVPIQPDSFCDMDVTFSAPQLPADVTGMISFQGNGQSYLYEVEVSGTALSPLAVSRTDLDFGQVPVGGTRTLTVDITNVTDDTTVVVSVAGGGASDPFDAVQNCQGEPLAPGEFCTFTYSFTPEDAGRANGDTILTLFGVDYVMNLTGFGFNEPDYDMWTLEPGDLDFGNVPVGESRSLPTRLTFSGEGVGTLFLKEIDLGGPFTVTPNPENPLCAPLAEINVGEFCDFIVVFTPTDAQVYAGEDTVNFWGSEFTLTARGTGTAEATVPVGPEDTDAVGQEDPTIGAPEAEATELRLSKTGTDNVPGLAGLAVLFLMGGAVALVRSRRSAHSAR